MVSRTNTDLEKSLNNIFAPYGTHHTVCLLLLIWPSALFSANCFQPWWLLVNNNDKSIASCGFK